MYLKHYGLKKKPFDISPDPSFLWLGETHKEALAHMKYGILGDRRFLLITGDVGTGKTALIRLLVKIIDIKAIVVTIPDPDLTRLDFYNFLANELKMGMQFKTKTEFLIHFKKFLLDAFRTQKKVLLIIDEAQRLNHELLQEIRFLGNIDFDGQMMINIFLVGQNEFKDLLMDQRNKSVRDRVTASYQIKPLTEPDVLSYIKHRLRIAGASKLFFTPDAIHQIYLLTRGYPRLINILCDRALLSGYSMEKKIIDRDMIEKSAKELKVAIGSDRTKQRKDPKRQTASPLPDVHIPERTRRTARTVRAERTKRTERPSFSITPIIVTLVLLAGFLVYYFNDSLFGNSSNQANTTFKSQVPYRSLESYKEDPVDKNTGRAQVDLDSKDLFESENENNPQSDAGSPQQDSLSAAAKKRFVVYYEHDSSDFQAPARKKLNQISNIFFDSPPAELTIRGFTDSFGNENYNNYIAVERASNVKNYFVKKGIPASKIKIIGMGAEKQNALDMTLEERRKNRRVEIEFSANQEQKP
jgi:general secretion pathway protein A